MSKRVLDSILRLLSEAGVPFKEVTHAPTHTSEESARARGEDLGVGAKAILMKTNGVFRLFVLPADRKVDSGAIKMTLATKKIRFATAAELQELTGLVPGSVPPFGPPVLPFDVYADPAVGQQQGKVAFNAGSLTTSIIMAVSDWERVARPTKFSFGR